jgi:hypothetical protein
MSRASGPISGRSGNGPRRCSDHARNLPASSPGVPIRKIINAIVEAPDDPDDGTIRTMFNENAGRARRLSQGESK